MRLMTDTHRIYYDVFTNNIYIYIYNKKKRERERRQKKKK